MQVEIRIVQGLSEPRILIETGTLDEELRALAARLAGAEVSRLAGFREDVVELLDPAQILRVYAVSGKVVAATEQGEYQLRLRLYEAEERLSGADFVRISNSELVNLKKVRSFDLSYAGTICVVFQNGAVTYASRRYVPQIRKKLGF